MTLYIKLQCIMKSKWHNVLQQKREERSERAMHFNWRYLHCIGFVLWFYAFMAGWICIINNTTDSNEKHSKLNGEITQKQKTVMHIIKYRVCVTSGNAGPFCWRERAAGAPSGPRLRLSHSTPRGRWGADPGGSCWWCQTDRCACGDAKRTESQRMIHVWSC